MNAVLLAGLTDTEAAAVEIMIGMTWRDQPCVTLARGLALGVPEQGVQARACHCCVVDLFGVGMRRHSPDHERRLLDFLQGRSAVLLVWGHGGGWLESELPLQAGQVVTFLTVPYTSAGLREALQRVMTARRASQSTAARRDDLDRRSDDVPAAAGSARSSGPAITRDTPVVPAWRRALKLADRLQADRGAFVEKAAATHVAASARPTAPPPANGSPGAQRSDDMGKAKLLRERAPLAHGPGVPVAPTNVRLPMQAAGLKAGAFELLLDAIPPLRQVAFMRFVAQALQGEDAKLLSIDSLALVMDPRGGWLAAGLPLSALLKMLHTPRLLESLKMQPLPVERIEETVREHLGGRFRRAQKPLDVITWELTSAALKDVKLEARGDLTLQLRRFPNFTLLQQVGPLDVQLAAICARMPQSIHDLMRAFPRREQDILRFAALCVSSGLAVVIPAASSVRVPPPPRAGADAGVRQGFFKSLLDKLF